MRIRGLLLDVEGVLVYDKMYQPVIGAVEFTSSMRKNGLPMRLITNNTTDRREDFAAKLHSAGFDFSLNEVHTCINAAISHLTGLSARQILVLGTEELQSQFTDAGFDVVAASQVDAVLVGLDQGLNFQKLQLACDAVHRFGAAFIALHRNRLTTNSDGSVMPSAGAIAEAICYATQVEPVVIGKPSESYFRQALDDLGVPPEEVLLVSDDPLSDVAGAKRMGMQGAFVLSGKYKGHAILDSLPPEQRPDVTLPAINDLLADSTYQFEPSVTDGY